MGDYFDVALKTRVMKTMYSDTWRNGKPKDRENGVSHAFKYLRLESYEDCLNNLEFDTDAERQAVLDANPDLAEEHLLHYMLDVETAGSASLLNIDGFADPTAYRLKVKVPGTDTYAWRPVDLIETFNYLLGLRVQHIAAPQTFAAEFLRPGDPDLPADQHTRLHVAPGSFRPDPTGPWWLRTVEGWLPQDPEQPQAAQNDPSRRRRILIVWRKLTGDLEQDNLVLDEWFRKHHINPRDREYDTIYVNGSNNLPNLRGPADTWKVRLIEEDFLRLMWDTEGA
jgi:adenine-specific DNA-methyltransferase